MSDLALRTLDRIDRDRALVARLRAWQEPCESCGVVGQRLYAWPDGMLACQPCAESAMEFGHKHVHDSPEDCVVVIHAALEEATGQPGCMDSITLRCPRPCASVWAMEIHLNGDWVGVEPYAEESWDGAKDFPDGVDSLYSRLADLVAAPDAACLAFERSVYRAREESSSTQGSWVLHLDWPDANGEGQFVWVSWDINGRWDA